MQAVAPSLGEDQALSIKDFTKLIYTARDPTIGTMDTDSLSAFGERQRRLLTLLIETKDGLSADELADELAISRSAVHQHLNALARDGYMEKSAREPRGGRPGYAFRLTDRGVHLFPKQYALFSDLLIRSLKDRFGSEGLSEILRDLGRKLAREHAPRLRGCLTRSRFAPWRRSCGSSATRREPRSTSPVPCR